MWNFKIYEKVSLNKMSLLVYIIYDFYEFNVFIERIK